MAALMFSLNTVQLWQQNVLNSPRAVQMSVFVVRAFLKMRALLGDKRGLAQKLASLEKELKSDSMFTRLLSSRFCNESWTSAILQPSQCRRQSRELDSIREIWKPCDTALPSDLLPPISDL